MNSDELLAAIVAAEAVKQPPTQGPPGPRGPKGEIGIVWRGEWRADAVYSPGDAVENEGSSWIATSHSFGEAPGSVSTWDLLAQRGERGPRGVPGAAGGTAFVMPDVIDGGSA